MKIILKVFLIYFFASFIGAAYADDAKVSRRGVLYWNKIDNLCEMRLFHPVEKNSIKMAEMETSPQQLYFSKKWDKVYYRLYNKLFSLEWKMNTTPVYVLTFPDGCLLGHEGRSSEIWLDHETDRWRCVTEDTDLVKYPVIKKDGHNFLQYKNNLVEFNNRYNNPELGEKYALSILNVMEYDNKTGWKEVAYVSTHCDASSDPCFESLDPYRNSSSWTSFVDIVKKTSELFIKSNSYSVTSENGNSTWKFDINPESNSFIKVKVEDFLMYPGLSLVDRNTKKETVILNESETLNRYGFLGLSHYNNYLLVTVSNYLNRSVLVDLNNQDIIFTPPEESPVMWVNIPR